MWSTVSWSGGVGVGIEEGRAGGLAGLGLGLGGGRGGAMLFQVGRKDRKRGPGANMGLGANMGKGMGYISTGS